MTRSDLDRKSLRRLQELGSPVVSDALRELGYPDHIAEHGMRPVNRAHSCAGPVRIARFDATPDDSRDFGPLAQFIDNVSPGEVLVLAGSVEAAPGALWGDICSSVAERYQANGVVIDGFMRDELTLEESPLPVFSRGAFSRDSLGPSNIGAVDVPTRVGGLLVEPGHVVVADVDGVVFFEPTLLEDVLKVCEKMAVAEESLRKLLTDFARTGGSLYDAVTRVGTL